MREMNEYTAEVIRRAKAKKQRRRAELTRALGASCAGLICAFALLGVLGKLKHTHDGADALPPDEADGFIPGHGGLLPNDRTDGEETDGVNYGIADCEYVSAEIALNGNALFTLSSPEAAEAVADAVAEAKAASTIVKHAGERISVMSQNDAHLRLTAADGSTAEYLVIGNMLYRIGAGDGWLMPDEAAAKLMSQLDVKE